MAEELTVGNFTYLKNDKGVWMERYSNRQGVTGRWSLCSVQVSNLLDRIETLQQALGRALDLAESQ